MDKKKRAEWTETFREWQESGKSIAGYCKDKNIPFWKFYYWKKKILSPDKKCGFTRLSLTDRSKSSSGLWIEISPGIRLIIERGFSSEDLSNVLRTLRGL